MQNEITLAIFKSTMHEKYLSRKVKNIIEYNKKLLSFKYTIVHEQYTIFKFSGSKTNHLVLIKKYFPSFNERSKL